MADFGMIDERLREIQSMLTGPVMGEPHPDQGGAIAVAAPGGAQTPAEPPQPQLSRFAAPIPPPAPSPPPVSFAGPGMSVGHAVPEHPNTPSPAELSERAVIEPAEARARALIATAELEAARIVADSRAEVQELARQIDELVILRDRLAHSVAEHQQALAAPPPALEPQQPHAPGAAGVDPAAFADAASRLPVGAPIPSAAVPPVQDVPAALAGYTTHPHTPGSWESATPATPYAPAAVSQYAESAAPEPEPVHTPPNLPVIPGTFGSEAGVITLIVGQFDDVTAIERFEHQLSGLASLDDVYLRAYDSGRAILELTLPAPAPLVSELQAVSGLTVVNETPAALVASLGTGGHIR